MNHPALKKFAAEARKNFRKQIGARLDYWVANDSAEHRKYASRIAEMKAAVNKAGGGAVLIDRVAYTWFNRFAALRYLDAAGQPFGAKVIMPAVAGRARPEILQNALDGNLPDKLTAAEPALAGTVTALRDGSLPSRDPDSEIYKNLLFAACHFHHAAMPFLFEKLDSFEELLLPEDLVSENSLLAGFRQNLTDEDCAEVEVIGWLYQYYIAEKKDEVMARKAAVPTEDIPAVTQLFTPHWIVRYLVENSLGRLWLLNRPDSKLREKMPYFVASETPQTDFLKVEKPEDIKVFDPACGSGHMLTYAFDLLKEIYAEEGHNAQDAARLILENNLYGADLCPRAAALAGFALVMKARKLDPRLLSRANKLPPVPHITALTDVKFEPGEISNFARQLGLGGLFDAQLMTLLGQFEQVTTFGSLIRPVLDAKTLAFVRDELAKKDAAFENDLFLRGTVEKVRLVLDQAELLTDGRYQIVVANPPYMGGKQMNKEMKEFAGAAYPDSKSDLFAMFIERGFEWVPERGFSAMVTMQSWMFLSSYEEMRKKLLSRQTIHAMAHLDNMVMGIAFGTAATVVENQHRREYKGHFSYVDYADINDSGIPSEFPVRNARLKSASSSDFAKIPGFPIAYWVSESVKKIFNNGRLMSDVVPVKKGIDTGSNGQFLRFIYEVNERDVSRDVSSGKWFTYIKGGEYKKWFGNTDLCVNWEHEGRAIKSHPSSTIRNEKFMKKPAVTWTLISNKGFGARIVTANSIFDNNGSSVFPQEFECKYICSLLNSVVAKACLSIINPTVAFQVGDIARIPVVKPNGESIGYINSGATHCVQLAKSDWNAFETAWDFADHPFLRPSLKADTLAQTWANWDMHCRAAITEMQRLETENNRLWIDAYGLHDELKPEVPEAEITLARADRRTDAASLVSYAFGCAFGRYSPDKPGLVLANAGDTAARYYELTGKTSATATLPVDEDGILPVLDGEWFEDDATGRVATFIRKLWGDATLAENLAWLEESLGTDLRSYLAKDFFKDHLKTYKKRPIYWQVSSPKGAFRALFYLHRYDRDTVNRLLNDYIRAFLHKLEARHATNQGLLESAAGPARTRLVKEQDKIQKQLKEIRDWERDTVLPLAQSRIPLDLDDGVKVNYLKFPGLLTPIPGLADKEDE